MSIPSCIELAILRLQTLFNHKRQQSGWEFKYFDSQGEHNEDEINSTARSWDSLSLTSANGLREELEMVAKILAAPQRQSELHSRSQWREEEDDADNCDCVSAKILELHHKGKTIRQIQVHHLLASLKLSERSIRSVIDEGRAPAAEVPGTTEARAHRILQALERAQYAATLQQGPTGTRRAIVLMGARLYDDDPGPVSPARNSIFRAAVLRQALLQKKIVLQWIDTSNTMKSLGISINTGAMFGNRQGAVEALDIRLMPLEGLLQSSGWATCADAFSRGLYAEAFGSEKAKETIPEQRKEVAFDATPTGHDLAAASTPPVAPSTPAVPAEITNFSPPKRISSVSEAGRMAKAWVEWMEEGAEKQRRASYVKTLNRWTSHHTRQILYAWLEGVYERRRCCNLERRAESRYLKSQVCPGVYDFDLFESCCRKTTTDFENG